LVWPVFALLLIAVVFFSFTLVANLIAAPFYGHLAEIVLERLGIPSYQADTRGIVASLWRGFAAEIRRVAYFALRALPLLLISVIPVINLAAPMLWLLFGAWSLSLEFLSYPLEALGLDFNRQREVAKARRLDSMGFGGAVMLGLGIPFLNILIPPAAVVGATYYAVERRKAHEI
jgi:CysZ protein